MKTYHLITTNPPTLHEGFALNSLPPRIVRPEEMTIEEVNEGMPDGYKYVPELDQPEFDDSTHRLVRADVTLDGYGWTVEALTPEEIEARKPRVQGVTKLTIMRRLGGKWPILKGALASLPEAVQDAWNLAQEIRADDPLFVQFRPQLMALLEMADDEFDALLAPNEEV